MRKRLKWMLVVGSVSLGVILSVRSVQATNSAGFQSTQIAKGTFDEFTVRTESVPEGFGGAETDLWFSMQMTKGTSDLYVQSNVWKPGGTTGWHTHPGHSLIIVTVGTITAYDGDDPSCTPHSYTAGVGTGLIDANHVHMIRNESDADASTVVVQLVPEGASRRIDAAAPPNCPL